ncbi:hypothetical protein BN2877_54590 [Achromobacter xylosoxidans]|nr:hypothetical protein [Achromobacter xylosoxidans]CUR70017.1 hypothetical protein BN2877_54590 [Achromobacter xylosoxidans]
MFPDFRSPKAYVSLILLIVMFIVPVVTGTPFWTNLFVLLFVFSALSVAWNIVGGYAGHCRWATRCSTASAATPPPC